MKTATKATVVYMVEEQAKICSDWLEGATRKDFEEAERAFQGSLRHGGYVNAYERASARLLRAEMKKTMMRLIADACLGADPMIALELTKRTFQQSLLETVKRNDGSPEEHRVQVLRAESQGWAIRTIDGILTALRAVQA